MSFVKDYIESSNLEEEISYHKEEADYHLTCVESLYKWIDDHLKKYQEHAETLSGLKKSFNLGAVNV